MKPGISLKKPKSGEQNCLRMRTPTNQTKPGYLTQHAAGKTDRETGQPVTSPVQMRPQECPRWWKKRIDSYILNDLMVWIVGFVSFYGLLQEALNMRTVCFCILSAAVLVGGCASQKGESYALAGFNFAELDRVAILEVTGQVHGDTVKNQIGGFFEMELLKKGYSPIERRQVQLLLKEQEFQASDITSNMGAAQAGRVLNVPAVLLITIPKYKEEMTMQAKLVNVEDARILWIGNGSGTTGKTFATIAGAVAGAAAGVAVSGEDDRVLAGIGGAVLGGVAGQALSPQQEEQVRKVIAKVCESMPARFVAQR